MANYFYRIRWKMENRRFSPILTNFTKSVKRSSETSKINQQVRSPPSFIESLYKQTHGRTGDNDAINPEGR